jgi:hypothetical protein
MAGAPEQVVATAAPEAAPSLTPLQEVAVPTGPMLQIEAHLDVEARDVEAAAGQLRRLLSARGATITVDSVRHENGSKRAQFTFRVASEAVGAALQEIERLGRVHNKNIVSSDVSKEYFDTELRLRNLELALNRYAELLRQSTTVDELLRIEQSRLALQPVLGANVAF